ncbi:hypothetical protein [Natranaerobius trueperi]|uniref:hypothetical protein n=1 Tax=Natranaerobius trueperi TaxID=759412 RepID=UPI00146D119D|nr:hypothetical protein [Natranaerobius trueperi]
MNMPEGCSFNLCCDQVTDICREKMPSLQDLGEDRKVAAGSMLKKRRWNRWLKLR